MHMDKERTNQQVLYTNGNDDGLQKKHTYKYARVSSFSTFSVKHQPGNIWLLQSNNGCKRYLSYE